MKKIVILLVVLAFGNSIFAQNLPNDCANAITVCGNGAFTSNATGYGIQEVASCGGSEHNSLWLKINIAPWVVPGSRLGFDLIPNDPSISVDYDFWVFGADKMCGSLGSPIRCATSNPQLLNAANNHTGMTWPNPYTQVGNGATNPGYGDSYVTSLAVSPGQTYYIAIDRPHGDGGFEIHWTGTATDGAGAFNIPPTANDIVQLSQCSGLPGVAIFDLVGAKSRINSDFVNNTITFYKTYANAIDGISPIPDLPYPTSPPNPQTIYAKVVNNVTGCFTITDFILKVYPLPAADLFVSKSNVCSGDSVAFTFKGTPGATVEYTVNGGGIQTVLLDATGNFVLNQTITATTTYKLVVARMLDHNGVSVCYQNENDTVTVTIAENVPVFTQVGPICSGDALSALPTTSNNGITGTWSPAINNTATTIYTFTPTAGQCASNATMTIDVNLVVTPDFTQVSPICSGQTLSPLPTTSNNGVTGAWSPALNNTATTLYTFTPSGGVCVRTTSMTIVVNQKGTPTFTQVAAICSGQTLSPLPTTSSNGITGSWSPALNNTSTTTYTFTPASSECAVSTTMIITVNSNVTPIFTQVASICSGGTLSALPTTSNNGITGTWSPTLDNTVTKTYTFTPTVGQCAVSTTMTITVNLNVKPTFSQVSSICSGDALVPLPTTSTNGITGTWSPVMNNTVTTTYTFTPTAGLCATTASMTITVTKVTPTFTQVPAICSGGTMSALPTTSNNGVTGTWSPALNNTLTTTYTFTPTTGQCAVSVTMTITVNSNVTPIFTQFAPICSGQTLAPLPTTSNNGVTGTWSPALNNTITTTYTFTPTIGQCAVSTTMSISVTSKPIVTVINNTPSICSGEQIDITLNCNNVSGATIHWNFLMPTATGGSTGSGVGPIHLSDLITLSNGITVPTTISLIVYAESSCRGDATQINITINPLPTPVIAGGSICMDSNNNIISNYTLNTGLSNANHTFVWYHNGVVIPGATTSTYTVDAANEVGLYEVEATNTTTTCHSTRFQALVDLSQPAQAATYVVSNYFEENQTITINVVGTGDYLYSLDGGEFQTSNVFSHVSIGEHFVTVHDTKGCTDITIEHIFTIGYPHYFTPNGDGYHDTWNVWSLSNQPNAIIYIFDRFGKLIRQIKPTESGWDGTFNGAELPSTDYWFSIQYNENQIDKVFKAHFSLKR
ncbi:MAG: T9SS type B sorting domain-containing protein [Bacteroidota bacterium]